MNLKLKPGIRVAITAAVGLGFGLLYLFLVPNSGIYRWYSGILSFLNPLVVDFVIPVVLPNLICGVIVGDGVIGKIKHCVIGMLFTAMLILYLFMFTTKFA